MIIVWKDIKGYEGLYQINNIGQVKSLSKIDFRGHIRKEKFLKIHNNRGYLRVILCKNGHCTNYQVHRLVAEAFLPNPNNYPQVNHKTEIKSENIVWLNEDGSISYEKTTIEWCSIDYNNNYGTRNIRISLNAKGKHINRTDLSKVVLQFDKDGNFIKEWPSAAEIQRATGIQYSSICKCCRNVPRYLSAGGYIWKYKH